MKKSLCLGVIAVAVTGAVWAHSGDPVLRYVATDGKDTGQCEVAKAPCRSLNYALKQATKGDEIRVADGSYHMKGDARFSLLTGIVTVKTGYSRKDGFQQQQKDGKVVLTGIPTEFQDDLMRRGFAVVQDSKAADFDHGDAEQLALYKAMTQKIEGAAPCVDGKAGIYNCNKMELLSHIPLNEFSINPTFANDIWGFVDKNDNHEYIAIGLDTGTSFIDVTDPKHPREAGSVRGNTNDWRDISIYQFFDTSANRWKSYAYVTSEGQGLQLLDLTELPNRVIDRGTITSYFSSAHTLYINTDYAYGTVVEGMTPNLYIAGASSAGGSWQSLDLVDPLAPKRIWVRSNLTRADGEYMHDATGMLITDSRTSQCAPGHNPCEILFDFNERSLDIWDTTDKLNPVRLVKSPYSGARYSHSGWYSKDKRYMFLNDELDERDLGHATRLRTFDISDLKNPAVVASVDGPTHAIDHNTYTIGDRSYISHYRRGVVMMDVTDPLHITEVASFDTSAAFSDDSPNFNGAWGVYPFLPSGTVGVSDIEGGLYLVRYTDPVVAIKETNLSVKESAGTVSVKLLRRGDSSAALSVNYATVADTAADSDYTATSGVVSWGTGDISEKTVNIALTQDTANEGIERFKLVLSNASAGASLGQHEALIAVRDKMAGSLGFTVSTLSVNESANSATISVARSNGSEGAVSIDFATQSGTASAADFTASSGSLNWAEGDSSTKTIVIPIANDSDVESAETFQVLLSNPTGSAAAGISTVVVTILDNDTVELRAGSLGLSVTNVTVQEDAGQATLTVTRTDGSDGDVTVDYTTEADSAGSSDFTATNGRLSWSNGDSSAKTITVAINNDNVEEGDESFDVVLSNATGGASTGNTRAEITIPANDKDSDGGGSVPVLMLLASSGLLFLRRRHRV